MAVNEPKTTLDKEGNRILTDKNESIFDIVMPWEDWFPKKYVPLERRKDKTKLKDKDGLTQKTVTSFFCQRPPTNVATPNTIAKEPSRKSVAPPAPEKEETKRIDPSTGETIVNEIVVPDSTNSKVMRVRKD